MYTERWPKPQPVMLWSEATTELPDYPIAPTEFPIRWSAALGDPA